MLAVLIVKHIAVVCHVPTLLREADPKGNSFHYVQSGVSL